MPRPIQSEPIGKPPRRVQPKGREVIINDSDDLLRCDVGDPVDCNEMLQIPDPILMTSSGRRYRRYRRYRPGSVRCVLARPLVQAVWRPTLAIPP